MLLEVKGLKTNFYTSRGVVPAVNDVSFSLDEGRVLAIVGESGSGKSVTAMSIIRLVSKPGKTDAGEILFEGRDILKMTPSEVRALRGQKISVIFQEPMTSLNPVMTCGAQVKEVLQVHKKGMSKEAMNQRVIELFELVGIPDAERRMKEFPYQLSGGMRQRVMIAIALACEPKLLIADEPTTALDVTIQAQILDLLRALQKKMNMAILLITHDLGVVAEMADDVIVMYGGSVQESGTVEQVLHKPIHPYTLGLINSIPTLDGDGKNTEGRLNCIRGTVPSLINLPPGCVFCPRCDYATDRCKVERPPLLDISGGRRIACWQKTGEREDG